MRFSDHFFKVKAADKDNEIIYHEWQSFSISAGVILEITNAKFSICGKKMHNKSME